MPLSSDDNFIGYCETHSKTERHLFHRDHANRLLRLAGMPEQPGLGEYVAIDEWTVKELVDAARERLKKTVEVCDNTKKGEHVLQREEESKEGGETSSASSKPGE